MIDAYVKANRMDKALACYDEMINETKLKADAFTYSTLIKGIKKPECLSQ